MQHRQRLKEKYRNDQVILECRKDIVAATRDKEIPPDNLVSRFFDKKTAILLQILLELEETNNSTSNVVLPFLDEEERGNLRVMPSGSGAMIHFAITMFAEQDRFENSSIYTRMALIQGLTRGRILNQLAEFVASANQVKITPETVSLWRELAIWLECMYQGTTTGDAADLVLKRMVNVKKFEIIKYYHLASLCLLKKIDAFQRQEPDAEVIDRDYIAKLGRMI